MRRTAIIIYFVMLAWAVGFYYLVNNLTDKQQQLNAAKNEIAIVEAQVNEQQTWLAEIQADIWDLQAQDEAFSKSKFK